MYSYAKQLQTILAIDFIFISHACFLLSQYIIHGYLYYFELELCCCRLYLSEFSKHDNFFISYIQSIVHNNVQHCKIHFKGSACQNIQDILCHFNCAHQFENVLMSVRHTRTHTQQLSHQ